DVVGNQRGGFDLKDIEYARNVAALCFLVVTAGRLVGESHSAQVWSDNRVVGLQRFGERRPHVSRLAITVQQNDGRARAANAGIKVRPVRRDLSLPKGLGKSEAL